MSVDELMERLDRMDHAERLAALVQHVRGNRSAQADGLVDALQAELKAHATTN